MRHVPFAEFQDRASEIAAAIEAGEEVTLTRDGRDFVRMVVVSADRLERQRAAVDALFELGQQVRAKHGPTTAAEIREWINEGRH